MTAMIFNPRKIMNENIDPMNLKTAWHNCPYCNNKVIVNVSDKDNELELVTDKDYE